MSQHLAEYNMGLAQYLLAGTAACYRGYRLYDTPNVAGVVAHWVSIYKQYRDIIISDIIHIRRPNGQTLDSFMHANAFLPAGRAKGFAAIFNPTNFALSEVMSFPLYYTGIETTALVSLEGAAATPYALARDYSIRVNLTVPAQGVTWFAIMNGDGENAAVAL